MKRFIASITIGISILSTSAFASVGGPFDNGFHGAGLERGAIYQASFTIANGTGYAYFTPDAVLSNIGGVNSTQFDNRASMKNRAVIYYKGITYVGSAMGTVDGEARRVQCTMNGASELSIAVQSSNTQANFFTLSANTSSVSGTVVQSNRSFTFNGAFDARVYQTAPSFRFKGTGEIVFLSPTSPDSVAGLAYTGYSGLIDAIITFIAGSRVVPNASIVGIFSDAQTAINNALTGLTPYLSLGGIDNTYANGKKAALHVTGTRRYL